MTEVDPEAGAHRPQVDPVRAPRFSGVSSNGLEQAAGARAPLSDHALSDRPVGERAVCPYFHEAVELVGKRWTGAIVHALLPSSLRFSELTQAVPQISDRLLSMRLRELESCGIVTRMVYEESPVRVEYGLTAKGRALEPAVGALRAWAREWLQD